MPIKRTVTATLPSKKDVKGREQAKTATITINDGETATEQVKMFGEEAVKSNASGHWDVTLQAAIRRGLAAGKTQEQIQQELASARMGVKVKSAPVDPQQAFLAMFATMTPEQQAAEIKKLQKRAAELGK